MATSTDNRLRRRVAELEAQAAVQAAGGSVRLLTAAVAERLRVDALGSVVVVDDSGRERPGVTAAKILDEWRRDPAWADAFQAPGAGKPTTGGTTPKGALTPEKVANMPMSEYRALRAQGVL